MEIMNTAYTIPKSQTKHLRGKVIDKQFKFDCGYILALDQICWLANEILHDGDEVEFDVINVQTITHQHKYQCSCGKVHE